MLRTIIFIIIAVLVLSFFGITIQSIVHSPAGEANFGFLGSILAAIYDFISTLVIGLYNWIADLFPHH